MVLSAYYTHRAGSIPATRQRALLVIERTSCKVRDSRFFYEAAPVQSNSPRR